MSDAGAEALASVLLIVTLAGAVIRPRGLPEAAVALPAAAVLLVTGVLPVAQARDEARSLTPTLGFLAAVLVLASLCDGYGLFDAAGALVARGSRGRPVRLLALVFVVVSLTTAALSLDATVVLLTPVVLATVARLGLRGKPPLYACTHLANSASLLLPVSNLTNLLGYRASGLSFARFAATMTLPWLVAIAGEWLVLRRFFAADLVGHGSVDATRRPVPVLAVVVVGCTMLGFFVTSPLGVDPAFAALAGAVVLAAPALATRRASLPGIGTALDVPFLAFVLALALIVRAVSVHGLGSSVAELLPHGASLGSLLLVALVAAVLANLVNNLPAVLLLLPAASASGSGSVLAVLVGVNIGPNLTYTGSLATLLWRRVLHQRGTDVAIGEFVRLGALTVPTVLLAATVVLWVSLHVLR